MIIREQYISHPRQIPICLESNTASPAESHQPLSYGGLRCLWRDKISVGRFLRISLPEINPRFFASTQVIWRRMLGTEYELGLVFLDQSQAYEMRMLEQICHITCYQQWILQQEGRVLNRDQAALEWIHRFAGRFPRVVD